MPSSTVPENTNKARRSRITAACAVCRGKRQKCSGEKYVKRPVCDQCRLHNEECWWSETKKRGPAKDYLRSLQDRLQETERLLLGVLSHMSDSVLAEVLQSDFPATSSSHQTWSSAMSGQEYWARFPLNRLESIRAWEINRRSGGQPLNGPEQFDYRMSIEGPTTSRHQEPLPSPQQPRNTSIDSKSAVNGAPSEGNNDSNAHRSEHRRNDSWAPAGPSGIIFNGRRYSEETREAGEALFSISNHMRTAPQQDQPKAFLQQNESYTTQAQRPLPAPSPYPQQWPAQATPQIPPISPPKSEPAQPGHFPKHLFW